MGRKSFSVWSLHCLWGWLWEWDGGGGFCPWLRVVPAVTKGQRCWNRSKLKSSLHFSFEPFVPCLNTIKVSVLYQILILLNTGTWILNILGFWFVGVLVRFCFNTK